MRDLGVSSVPCSMVLCQIAADLQIVRRRMMEVLAADQTRENQLGRLPFQALERLAEEVQPDTRPCLGTLQQKELLTARLDVPQLERIIQDLSEEGKAKRDGVNTSGP